MPRGDEIAALIQFIVAEMNSNRLSSVVRTIRALNSHSYAQCIAAFTQAPWYHPLFMDPRFCLDQEISTRLSALASFGWLVRSGGIWDHKSEIRRKFHPATSREQVWHYYQGQLYYYDIWSNIHYGYIGSICGFSESSLLDGAGLEQAVNHPFNIRRTPGVAGLRAFDDPQDQAAVRLGMRMAPHPVKPSQVLKAVLNEPGLDRKPLPTDVTKP